MPSPLSTAVPTGGRATETALQSRAAGYRVLHFATHGVADSRWPMYSALLFTATPEDDGILEAREIVDLPLHAELAVLSACNTGGGWVGGGEGVIGLSRAFLVAGCPTTVVSQWSTESRSTEKLMVAFHRHLLGGDSKAEALRAAMLELRRQPRYRNAFYWAPFIVIGAP